MSEMFIWVWGVREAGPVVIPALAWSHGASGSSRYDAPPAPADLDAHRRRAKQWSVDEVCDFVKKSGKLSDEQAKLFRDHWSSSSPKRRVSTCKICR